MLLNIPKASDARLLRLLKMRQVYNSTELYTQNYTCVWWWCSTSRGGCLKHCFSSSGMTTMRLGHKAGSHVNLPTTFASYTFSIFNIKRFELKLFIFHLVVNHTKLGFVVVEYYIKLRWITGRVPFKIHIDCRWRPASSRLEPISFQLPRQRFQRKLLYCVILW